MDPWHELRFTFNLMGTRRAGTAMHTGLTTLQLFLQRQAETSTRGRDKNSYRRASLHQYQQMLSDLTIPWLAQKGSK